MKINRFVSPALIISAAVVLRVGFAVLTPAWQSPDEYPHYWYAEQIAVTGHLPQSEPVFPAYEAFQPPLYYFLIALPIRLAPVSQPFIAEAAARPSSELIWLRFLSILMVAATLAIIWKTVVRLKWLTNSERLTALALSAFLPTWVGTSATLNNDTLTVLLASVSLYYALAETDKPGLALAGFWAGLALLSKLTALILLPALVTIGWSRFGNWSERLKACAVMLGAWAIGAGLLAARNVLLYDSLLAINPGMATEPGMDFSALIHAMSNFFGSFFFAFGRTYQIHLPVILYLIVFLPMSLVALAGWIRIRKTPCCLEGKRLFVPIILGIALSLAYTLSYPFGTMTSWGKNLFPLLLPISVFTSVGWSVVSPRFGEKIALAGMSVLVVFSLYGLWRIALSLQP